MLLLSPQICGNVLQQPQEDNPACLPWPVLAGPVGPACHGELPFGQAGSFSQGREQTPAGHVTGPG